MVGLQLRLSGWQRLGIVLSLLWVLISLAAVYSFNSSGELGFKELVVDESVEPIVSTNPDTDEETKVRQVKEVPAYGAILKLIFFPIIGMWVIFGALIYAVRWVWRGFKSEQSN